MRMSSLNGAAIASSQRLGHISVPQNVAAREATRRIINLPVPPEFDIARLTADKRSGSRFEAAVEARERIRPHRKGYFLGHHC